MIKILTRGSVLHVNSESVEEKKKKSVSHKWPLFNCLTATTLQSIPLPREWTNASISLLTRLNTLIGIINDEAHAGLIWKQCVCKSYVKLTSIFDWRSIERKKRKKKKKRPTNIFKTTSASLNNATGVTLWLLELHKISGCVKITLEEEFVVFTPSL